MSMIVQDGDPVLRETAIAVPDKMFGTPELLSIVADMKASLDREPDGVAIAAPQIGISYRMFVVRFDRIHLESPEETAGPQYGVFINPEISKSSRRRIPMDEGCLSVRGLYGTTLRHERTTVRAQDEHGKKFERGAGDLLAQAFQHETDHLDGILFIDRAERLYRPDNKARAIEGEHKPFVFFGTPYVARDTLAELVARGRVPLLVITSEDAPQGRGQKVAPCETKEWALAHDIPVFSPENIDVSAIQKIEELGAEYAIVVAYGKILPQKLIDAFPLGALNVHYSLLPKYRGASPVEAALLNADTHTGVTIQKMKFELDAGDVLSSKVTAIDPLETTRELRPRLIELGAELLSELLPDFEAGTVVGAEQDHTKATMTARISKESGELSLSGDAHQNWNKYRAYAESPGTYFFAERNGKKMRVKIKTAKFENGVFMPLRVVPEGKKEMEYADFERT